MESNKNGSMGKRIAQLRRDKGYTQEQLAEKMGVSPQAVSKWENDISCPDISALPLLGDILGVTTDELLGVKPIEPHVVVVQPEKKEKDTHISINLGSGKRDSIVFSVLLIIGGLIYILGRMDIIPGFKEIGFWSMVWPYSLIIASVMWSLHSVSPFSLGLGLFGLYYFLHRLGVIPYSAGWDIIWPVGVVLIGLTGLFYAIKKKNRKHCVHYSGKHGSKQLKNDGGFVKTDIAFGDEIYVVSPDEPFSGADLNISFGEFTLDLTNISLTDNTVIKASVSFGELRIKVPRNILVMRDVTTSFGSCNLSGAPLESATQKLYIKGDASFGNVDIKYH